MGCIFFPPLPGITLLNLTTDLTQPKMVAPGRTKKRLLETSCSTPMSLLRCPHATWCRIWEPLGWNSLKISELWTDTNTGGKNPNTGFDGNPTRSRIQLQQGWGEKDWRTLQGLKLVVITSKILAQKGQQRWGLQGRRMEDWVRKFRIVLSQIRNWVRMSNGGEINVT